MPMSPATMEAMVLHHPGEPLAAARLPVPRPAAGEVLLQVLACGVCRTDLHIVDGELPFPGRPVIPGHEIVGRVAALGPGVTHPRVGELVGVGWLGTTCGRCDYCRTGRENLCDTAAFTGYQLAGGFAGYTVAHHQACFPLPPDSDPVATAPLLCAGLIGHRAYTMAGGGQDLGIYGFGAAAHILTQIARHQGRKVYAFTRPGKEADQAFARSLGAVWAGDSDQPPPHPLDAAIIFAPAGHLVVEALSRVKKGGTVVCAGIHMSDIPSFPYRLLWGERRIVSVANLCRGDGPAFFAAATAARVTTTTTAFPLTQANQALEAVRRGTLHGAAVLVPDHSH